MTFAPKLPPEDDPIAQIIVDNFTVIDWWAVVTWWALLLWMLI